MKSGFHKVIRADNLVELEREFEGETELKWNSATTMIVFECSLPAIITSTLILSAHV
jgi:hypothetical protein